MALSLDPLVYSCWHWNNPDFVMNKLSQLLNTRLNHLHKDDLLECMSAFNGFGMYRLSKLDNCAYNGMLDINLFDNTVMNDNINALNSNVCNAVKIVPLASSPFNNMGKSDCEHRNFHSQMILKNNAKIRISPLYVFKSNSGLLMNCVKYIIILLIILLIYLLYSRYSRYPVINK